MTGHFGFFNMRVPAFLVPFSYRWRDGRRQARPAAAICYDPAPEAP
jgi:hypothetical protein